MCEEKDLGNVRIKKVILLPWIWYDGAEDRLAVFLVILWKLCLFCQCVILELTYPENSKFSSDEVDCKDPGQSSNLLFHSSAYTAWEVMKNRLVKMLLLG